jgi:predicted ester cyclase
MDWRAHTVAINDATYRAWNAHDPDAVAAVFALDARVRDAGAPTWEVGREVVRARAAMLLDAFPDLRLERATLVIDGPHHADRWTLSGTHLGLLFGIEPTGRAVRVEGATFTTLSERDGEVLVVEDVHHIDTASLLGQLGVT